MAFHRLLKSLQNKRAVCHPITMSAPFAAVATFWNVGRRIVEEGQKGESRAAYDTRLIHLLADRLKAEYGDGYGKRNAFFVSKQYLLFSAIFSWDFISA